MSPHRRNSSRRRIQNLPGELFEAATPLVIGYILWMGQRNPAPVENGGKHPSHRDSTILLVVQDFAGPSTVAMDN